MNEPLEELGAGCIFPPGTHKIYYMYNHLAISLIYISCFFFLPMILIIRFQRVSLHYGLDCRSIISIVLTSMLLRLLLFSLSKNSFQGELLRFNILLVLIIKGVPLLWCTFVDCIQRLVEQLGKEEGPRNRKGGNALFGCLGTTTTM